jgi:hypothetical protein
MKRPQLLVWGLIWVSVVVAACGVTWVIIDSVGRDVLAGTASEPLPVSTASTEPSTRPGQGVRRSPSADPTSPMPTPSDSPSSTPSNGPPTSPPPAAPLVESWQGSAGSVTVRCDGGAASLQSASPDDGWGMELDKQGPGEVRVEFETGGDDERRTRVRAWCGSDGPLFEVDVDD